MSISKRLKELRETARLSQKKIALELKITQGAYSLIENGQNSITTEHLLTLSRLYSVPTDQILKSSQHAVTMSPKNGFIPLINVEAHAGFVENGKDEEWLGSLKMYRIPGYDSKKNQKLFEVEGDSMMPTLINGDILIVTQVNDVTDIMDGSLVVVVTSKAVITKRIKKDLNNNSVILISDNPKYDNMSYPLKNIEEILIVEGKITNALNVPDFNGEAFSKKFERSVNNMQVDVDQILEKLKSL
ncbi:XRE family transcriptional regulator [Flavimarina sp. Hel_I_48]|uniref:XRE family transcriptional regulator n=1 Tax=Flavimarina sp. Hel_I_48 TaxID=1392488 RepID=UPI0004DFB346|nr:LexA family transcriptional regulator [Flavimarina sp. Hel_I_48]